jgi:hypothetical protein
VVNRSPDVMRMFYTEAKALAAWLSEHFKTCEKSHLICIEQTYAAGLGTNTYVECGCGLKSNITDYELW